MFNGTEVSISNKNLQLCSPTKNLRYIGKTFDNKRASAQSVMRDYLESKNTKRM